MEPKFGEMTEQEERDYAIGSSKFYSEGAKIACNLDDLYNIIPDEVNVVRQLPVKEW